MIDLRNMQEVFTYKASGDVTSLNCTDRLIFSGNGNGSIDYFESFVAEPIAMTDAAHDNTIWALEMHPMGHCLASGSADNQVRFWVRQRPGITEAE